MKITIKNINNKEMTINDNDLIIQEKENKTFNKFTYSDFISNINDEEFDESLHDISDMLEVFINYDGIIRNDNLYIKTENNWFLGKDGLIKEYITDKRVIIRLLDQKEQLGKNIKDYTVVKYQDYYCMQVGKMLLYYNENKIKMFPLQQDKKYTCYFIK